MFVIGLTGGIGTGKTEVAHVLRELGAVVIESDKVAHLSYEPGTTAHREISRQFGNTVLDSSGIVDRTRLDEIVFASLGRRSELESIVWPAVKKWITARLAEEEKRGTETVVIEVPKLYEAGWDGMVHTVWTVEAPEDVVVRRLEKRSGWSESDIKARSDAQMSRQERVAIADRVIENDTTIDELQDRVRKIWETIPGRPGSIPK